MLCAGATQHWAAGRQHAARSRRRALRVAGRCRCCSAGEPAPEQFPAPAEPAQPAAPALTPEATLLPPQSPLRWAEAVDVAVSADVFQFSAADAAGLPLWSPAGLAVTLAALAAARKGRASRHSAVEELSTLLSTRRRPVDEEAKTVAVETLEQLKAQQRAEAKRQAEEAALEAARVAEDLRAQQAEQARLEAEQAAAKLERDARQRVLDAERQAREEAAAELRREAERQAQAEAVARAAEEAARRAEAEAERVRQEEAQRQLREEERRRRGIKTVTARFKGEVSVAALPGALYEAMVSARVLGAATAEVVEKRELRSAEELRAAVPDVCRAAASKVVDTFGGDARARSLLGAGPLTVLDDNELDHWLRMLRLRVAAVAERAMWRLSAEAEVGARSARGAATQAHRSADLAVADVRDVAPPADEASARGRVERALDALASVGDAAAARSLVDQLIAEDTNALSVDTGMERAQVAFYATVLVLAYFLDCAKERLQPESEAHAACSAFAADMLQSTLRSPGGSTWKSFYLDGESMAVTEGVCDSVRELLGAEHPLCKALLALAGPAARPAVAALEEEEWPDENAVRAARIADAQQSAPVPERVWAMRNAAGTLAMTGARAQAVDLLSSAVALKADWLGSDMHAGLLGELCDLHNVLDDAAAAADVAARILRICEAVANADAAEGRVQQAVEILEGAAAAYASAAGNGAARLRARAAELGSAGTSAARTDVVRAIAVAAAPQLEVHKTPARWTNTRFP